MNIVIKNIYLFILDIFGYLLTSKLEKEKLGNTIESRTLIKKFLTRLNK